MIKRIPVNEVKLGMFIQELHGSWIKHPFWKTKFLLNDPEDLAALKICGVSEVSIDLSRSKLLTPSINSGVVPGSAVSASDKVVQVTAEAKNVLPVKSTFTQEFARARELCQRSKSAVINMFGEARMGKAISLDTAAAVVEEITASVERHPQALITLARLKTSDDYTYMHSVAVCAMMVALARELGMDEEQVRLAGSAGLLHDVGKMAVPDNILNKPGSLSDEEFSVIKTHPGRGADILRAAGDVPEKVIDVCLHHHEKYDGSGYPHGLRAEQIDQFARMAAICDVYDAITSNRSYKKGWGPAESIQRMVQWKGHFDPILLQAFIKTMGIYPTGSLVRLKSQRLAIVVDQNEGKILQPKVKVFFSITSKLPIPQQLLDLSSKTANDSIEAREPLENWNFPYLNDLLVS